MFTLTFEIFSEIKAGYSPEEIIQHFSRDLENKYESGVYTKYDLSIVNDLDRERYVNEEKKSINRLRNYLYFLQESCIPKIDNDRICFLVIGLLLFKNCHINFNDRRMGFHQGQFGIDGILELLIELNYSSEYVSDVVNVFMDYAPDYLEYFVYYPRYSSENSVLLHPRNCERISLRKIMKNLRGGDFEKMMTVMFESQAFRGVFILGDIIKNYIRCEIFEEMPELLEILINVMQKKSYHDKYNYFAEIIDLFEYDYFPLHVYEKMADYSDLSDVEIDFYGKKLKNELQRLNQEFERILNSDNLKLCTRRFFEWKRSRMIDIKNLISGVFYRMSKIRQIKRNSSAKKIQETWYNYVTRTCDPSHPKMQQRFREFLSYSEQIDSKN